MNPASPRSRWVYLLQGFLAIMFGLVALVWPGITLFAFILLFGAFAVVSGMVHVLSSLANRHEPSWWLLLITGLVGISAGVLALVWPGLTGLVLLLLIGAYALFVGATALLRSVSFRTHGGERWTALFRGIVAIVFGIVAIAWPGATAISLAWLIGIYALLLGASEIVFSFVVRRERSKQT